MAAPLLTLAAKFAAKKVAGKAASKFSDPDKGPGRIILAAALVSVLVVTVVISSVLGSFLTIISGGMGGAQAAMAEDCDTYAANGTTASDKALRDIPAIAMTAYEDAARTTGVDWPFIAAIGKVETDHGRHGGRHLDTDGNVQPTAIYGIQTAYGRAEGPMQFIPDTWDAYGKDGNNDGKTNPQNIFDAALATGFYLKASGAPADMRKAIFAYNHSTAYVTEVLKVAKSYTGSAGSVTSPQIGGTVTVAHANIPMRSGLDGFRASMPRVLSHSPDFVSLNEMFGRTVGQAEAAAPGYTAWRDPTPPGRDPGANQATDQIVMWKSSDWSFVDGARIKIVEDDRTLYNGNPALWDRFATWVTLKRKSDGALASMVSVHHMTNPGKFGPDRPARRALYGEGMKILLQTVGTLAAQGPVFVGGDMNVHANQQGQWTVTEKMAAAGYGWHAYNVDYVFYPKNSGVTMTQSWDGTMVSDHHWIAARFSLGSKGSGGPGPNVTTEHLRQIATVPPAFKAAMGAPEDGSDKSGSGGWTLPVAPGQYTLSARWGQRGSYWSSGYHTGLDFAAPEGTPVFAAAPGKVIPRPDEASWAGTNFLTIDHGTVDGKAVMTWYAHMSAATVTGGMVDGGQQIGEVGSEGNSTGAHLHFEVRVNGQDVDPQIWLAQAGAPDATGIASDGCGPTGSSGISNGVGAWGGYENGKIPLDALCKLSFYNTYFECNAAKALEELNTAYKAKFGTNVGPVGGYRDYAGQVACTLAKGSLCATPGTSNHGWGLAADLDGGGISRFGTPQHQWMRANAPGYGWVLPDWAQENGSKPEPWHWEFAGSGSGISG